MIPLPFRSLIHVTILLVTLLGFSARAQTDELQDVNQMLKRGQFDQALTRINSFLATRPKDARGRFLKGLILVEQNKPSEAISVFTELAADYPELPGPYNNLAVLYAQQGQYDKARGALEQAIRTHPSYATAHENLGDIYAKLASQAYDKALQLDKGNSTVQTKLNVLRDLFAADPRSAKSEAAKVELAKVATATAPAATKARDPEAVLAFVNAWAKSWSDNDVAAYLAAYATDFRTPRGERRAAWEAEIRARVAKPRKIQVTLDNPKVVFEDNNRATVTFVQHYTSDTLKSVNHKVLVMTKSGDKWLIQQELGGG